GGATSVLSLFALVRALGLADANRVARASEAVQSELALLSATGPSPEVLAAPATTYVGLRGGWTAAGEARPILSVPSPWRKPLAAVIVEAGNTGKMVRDQVPLGAETLVVAAQPAVGGKYIAWTGFMVSASAFLRPWRWITIALLLVTALLVIT